MTLSTCSQHFLQFQTLSFTQNTAIGFFLNRYFPISASITRPTSLFYSCFPLSYDSVTVSLNTQYQDPETEQPEDSAIFIYSSALDCDVISSVKKKGLLSPAFLIMHQSPDHHLSVHLSPIPLISHLLYTCSVQNCCIIYCGIGLISPGFVLCLWSHVCSPFGL